MKMKFLGKRVLLALGVVALSLGITMSSARADFIIDTFGDSQTVIAGRQGATVFPNPSNSVVATANAVGSVRDITVMRTATTSTTATSYVEGDSGANSFSLNASAKATGFGFVTYHASGPMYTGLGSVDLTQGGLNSAFIFQNAFSTQTVTVDVFVWQSSSKFAQGTLTIPGTDPALGIDLQLLFTSFVFSGGANASIFSAAGAVGFRVNGVKGSDTEFQLLKTAPRVIPEPASFALVGMGMLGTGFAAYRRRKMAV